MRELTQRDLRLQEEEVAAVVRLRLDDAEALYEGGEVFAEEWADGEASPISVRLADFVPGEDCYLLRAVRAARAVLERRDPRAVF